MKTNSNKISFLLDINDPINTVFFKGIRDNLPSFQNGEKIYNVFNIDFFKHIDYYMPYLKLFSPIQFDLKSFKSATGDILGPGNKLIYKAVDYEALLIKSTFKSKIYELISITGNFVIFTDETHEIFRISHENKNLRIFKEFEKVIAEKDTPIVKDKKY